MNTLGDVGEISITIHRESCNDYDSGLCDMSILVVGVGPVHITGLDNVHDSDSRASDLNIVIESGRKKVNNSVSRRPGQCEVNLIYCTHSSVVDSDQSRPLSSISAPLTSASRRQNSWSVTSS